MREARFPKKLGLIALALLVVSLLSRFAVGLPVAGAPSRKLLEWGTEAFDKMFELVSAQADSFQTESQLLIGAALVSGLVKALEISGTGSGQSPFWVGLRRVFAILAASTLAIAFLLASGGSLILLLGIAVSEDVILGSVVLKTLVALVVTVVLWFGSRWLLEAFTVNGPRLRQLRLPQTEVNEPETGTTKPPPAEA